MATETDGFAELVRGLKERSGLSYGALAKKLHVSTSTLHRYCNGDAVPTEFAPVERLGRLCGASRDELVALHRGWILADDARRRGRPGTAAAAVPEAVAVPAQEPEAVPDRETAPPAPVTVSPPEAVPARRSRKRLRVALAAAAVVLVAVPVAYAVGRAGGGGAGETAAGGRTAGPADGTGAKTPGSAEAGGQAAGAPISVGISSYNWDAPCGQYYVLDRKPDRVPPPPAPQDTRGWARALGAVDGGHMLLQLTATGRTDESVVLNALHVRVVERGAPLNRAAYAMGDGCGGIVTPQSFDIDLDAPRPFVKPVAGHDGDSVVPAKDFPYKVSTSDPQVLNLDVHTDAHVIGWYLELDWSSGDRHGTVRVDDGGKPFRTSAIEGKTVYGYRPDKGDWAAQQ